MNAKINAKEGAGVVLLVSQSHWQTEWMSESGAGAGEPSSGSEVAPWPNPASRCVYLELQTAFHGHISNANIKKSGDFM